MDDPSPGYWLAPDVFLCRVREAVIFLDLTRDRYQTVRGEQMHALGAVVHGWPADALPDSHQRGTRLAEQLRQKGLLTLDASIGKAATPADLSIHDLPVAVGIDRVRGGTIRFIDVINFVLAWICVSWSMRRQQLPHRVHAIQRRKRKHSGARFDEETAVALVCTFRRLRCYAFVARERCLFHALVLTEFLARYGLYPTFVMGVRLTPWGAHSWVQQGPLILNATPASIRDFTPILAV